MWDRVSGHLGFHKDKRFPPGHHDMLARNQKPGEQQTEPGALITAKGWCSTGSVLRPRLLSINSHRHSLDRLLLCSGPCDLGYGSATDNRQPGSRSRQQATLEMVIVVVADSPTPSVSQCHLFLVPTG